MINWEKALYTVFVIIGILVLFEIYERIKLKFYIARSKKRVLKKILNKKD